MGGHVRLRAARTLGAGVATAAVLGLLLPAHAALAAATGRYVSPFGTDTGDCSSASSPCATVQYAVNQAAAGDQINLAPGAYVEQVSITKSLSVVGAGEDASTIQAPTTLTADATTHDTYIVEITGSTTVVSMSDLTVEGPGPVGGGNNCAPNPLSLDKGIAILGGGTLNLTSAAVRNVYDRPTSGCQRGDAISVGSACYSCTADVGHATLDRVSITVYQKNGVAVRGAGSTLKMTRTTVAEDPSPIIASNGVEVVNGAFATVTHSTVSGNECNLASVCGSDPFTQTEASGILLLGSAAGTSVSDTRVYGNDMGVYTADGAQITQTRIDNNRYVGMYVDSAASGGKFTSDTANSGIKGADGYGFITLSGGGNTFSRDRARGNATYDMDAVISGTDTNTYSQNHCSLASPSRAYWACS